MAAKELVVSITTVHVLITSDQVASIEDIVS